MLFRELLLPLGALFVFQVAAQSNVTGLPECGVSILAGPIDLLNRLTINSNHVSQTCKIWRLHWAARMTTNDVSVGIRTSDLVYRIASVKPVLPRRTSGYSRIIVYTGVVCFALIFLCFLLSLIGISRLFFSGRYTEYVFVERTGTGTHSHH